MAEKYLITLDGEDLTYEIERSEDEIRVRREGDELWKIAHLDRVGGSELYQLLLNDRPMEVYLERRRGGARATIGRHAFEIGVSRWSSPSAKRAPRDSSRQAGLIEVATPMTGSIVEVKCSPGNQVEKGDVLLVVESMKMNNELSSPVDGFVEQVKVKASERVTAGQVLVVIRAPDD